MTEQETWKNDYFDPTGQSTTNGETPPEHIILDAPDYSTFVKITRTTRSREYERKINSVLKTGFFVALQNGQLPDAATILDKGPSFSLAAGNLADHDERAARIVDMLTAPDNPYVVFAITAIGLVGQLARNHEDVLQNVPQAVRQSRRERKARKAAGTDNGHRVQIHLPFGRTVSLALRFRFRSLRNVTKLFRLQTQDPIAIVTRVFSDEKLRKALEKQGIVIRENGSNPL